MIEKSLHVQININVHWPTAISVCAWHLPSNITTLSRATSFGALDNTGHILLHCSSCPLITPDSQTSVPCLLTNKLLIHTSSIHPSGTTGPQAVVRVKPWNTRKFIRKPKDNILSQSNITNKRYTNTKRFNTNNPEKKHIIIKRKLQKNTYHQNLLSYT